jgi:magnesium transporter
MLPQANQLKFSDPIQDHMRTDFPKLQLGHTVSEALEWVRRHPPQGRIVYFYVIDANHQLRGVVPTRLLLLSSSDCLLSDIMVGPVISLPLDATLEDACEFFVRHRLLAVPVVDNTGRLQGVVDMELYTDDLVTLGKASSQGDDLFQLIGVHKNSTGASTALGSFRLRFPWLTCNLGAGILAAFLTGIYQHELDQLVALAFFIPVVSTLAESVGSQSVSLTLQWMHGKTLSWRMLLIVVVQELKTGLLLGLGSGAIVALVAWIWLHNGRLAACLISAIAAGVVGSAVIGATLPLLLRLFRLPPQLAAGPIALAAADTLSLLTYLSLAHWAFA